MTKKHKPKQHTFPRAEVDALVALYKAQRFAEMESRTRALLERYPDFGFGWKLLGGALRAQGKEALDAFRKAAALLPDDAEVHFNLGIALKNLERLDDAIASYREAVALKPDYVEAHTSLGKALQQCGHLDAAEASFRSALEINAEYMEAILGISYLCVMNGKIKEAEEGIEKALSIKSSNPEARLLLATIRKTRTGDENLAALLATRDAALSGQIPLSNPKMIHLNFVLGKCYDDLGEAERAMEHFGEGCRLKRAAIEYDPEQTTRRFDGIMQAFGRSTLERLQGNGAASGLPIFVLGMPRSGTTLTEQIIASHPEVHGAGELPDLSKIARRPLSGTTGFPGNIAALGGAELGGWAADYIAGLQQRAPHARRITDKMPTNFLFLGLIHLMLPNARIIHVNRDPVDTCLSCFMQSFNGGHEYTYDLAELGRYYADYARLMAHWRTTLPAGAFLDVHYEQLVADQATQARRLIDFCGLDWRDECIDFHKHERPVTTASMLQVRQPIYRSSVQRWRAYEKFLGPLLDALGDLVPER